MKVVFFGSSNYCLPVVESLKTNFNLSAVVSRNPSSPIAKLASQGLPLRNYFPSDNLSQSLKRLNPDLAVVADYGVILPKEIFEMPKLGTVNIHFSKLPEFRGASPVQYTLLSGSDHAYITFQKMAEKMDSGDIIFQEKFDLSGREKTDGLYLSLFSKAAAMLPRVLNDYLSGIIKPIAQDESLATYTKILHRSDGFVPWNLFLSTLSGQPVTKTPTKNSAVAFALKNAESPSLALERAVRALHPWPGVWTEVPLKTGKKRLIISEGVLNDGRFLPQKVQLEGKKPVSWKKFLEGYQDSLDSTSSMALKSSLK